MRPGEEACAATGAPEIRAPCSRNTVLVTKYVAPKNSSADVQYDDDVLRYGQKIRLVASPAAQGYAMDASGGPAPLYLFSRPLSMQHFAKYSRQQLVGFTHRSTYDTVWTVVTPNPEERLISEGAEVMAGAPVLLMHCATQKPLCIEAHKVPNDFGYELELSARSAVNNGMKLALEQMFTGKLKGFMPKCEMSDNFWTFVGGGRVASLPEGEAAAAAAKGARATMDAILDQAGRSASGLFPLQQKLVTLADKSGELSQDELALVLKQVGLAVSDDAVACLLAAFPGSKPRFVDVHPLLTALLVGVPQ